MFHISQRIKTDAPAEYSTHQQTAARLEFKSCLQTLGLRASVVWVRTVFCRTSECGLYSAVATKNLKDKVAVSSPFIKEIFLHQFQDPGSQILLLLLLQHHFIILHKNFITFIVMVLYYMKSSKISQKLCWEDIKSQPPVGQWLHSVPVSSQE